MTATEPEQPTHPIHILVGLDAATAHLPLSERLRLFDHRVAEINAEYQAALEEQRAKEANEASGESK